MKTEFQIGENVTFKPYERPLPAVVKRIQKGWFTTYPGTDELDEREFYYLEDTGTEKNKAVKVWTTGISILESKLYEEHDKDGNKVEGDKS